MTDFFYIYKVAFSIFQFQDQFWHRAQHFTILCKKRNFDFEFLSTFKYAELIFDIHISASSSTFMP